MAVPFRGTMSYLLDTHSFIWLARGDRRLSKAVIDLVSDPDATIYLSVVSRWEIALKQRTDRYLLPRPFAVIFESTGFKPLNLDFDVPSRIATLPYHHKDPFDRMLIAQTMATGYQLVSRDGNIQKYDVPIFW
jgi:PIN domain nuclease of toxin-antitoxin system